MKKEEQPPKVRGDIVRKAGSTVFHLVDFEGFAPKVWTACGLHLDPEERPQYGHILRVTCTNCRRTIKGRERRRNPAR